MLPSKTDQRIRRLLEGNGNLVVLTGAGISAESGIPTFRGKDGFWVSGSKEYQPQQIATHEMFMREPATVWAWYLYRLGRYNAAKPNNGHRAIVALEKLFGDRFRLITQNVDGLHLRAGSSMDRIYQIHGNIGYARCTEDCGQGIWPLPETLGRGRVRGVALTNEEQKLLQCPSCGSAARPHVLWFDECYDEEHFRYESSIHAAILADALLVVGTSGATNLPMMVGHYAADAGALIIDINLEPNPFSRLAESMGGLFIKGSSSAVLPQLVDTLIGRQPIRVDDLKGS